MRTLEEIRKTPVQLLTDEEVNQLEPEDQVWARNVRAQRKRETDCPGHERVGTGSHSDSRRGWHPGKCKHCGMDMSYDSGD